MSNSAGVIAEIRYFLSAVFGKSLMFRSLLFQAEEARREKGWRADSHRLEQGYGPGNVSQRADSRERIGKW